MVHLDEVIPEVTVFSSEEARRLIAGGNVLRVRLSWDVTSDQFFSLASKCETYGEVKITRDQYGCYV